tara:strand:- start:845 stop:1126 length:282 start_codon:yes stop_codon:yes gene_type:complete
MSEKNKKQTIISIELLDHDPDNQKANLAVQLEGKGPELVGAIVAIMEINPDIENILMQATTAFMGKKFSETIDDDINLAKLMSMASINPIGQA